MKHSNRPAMYIDYSYDDYLHVVDGLCYEVLHENVGDEEINKRWTTVKFQDGSIHHVDWSPYSFFRSYDLELWLKAGMPKREDAKINGPLKKEDLLRLIEENKHAY